MKESISKEVVLIAAALIGIAIYIDGDPFARFWTNGLNFAPFPHNQQTQTAVQPAPQTEEVVKEGEILLTDQWSDVIDRSDGDGVYGCKFTLSDVGLTCEARDADNPSDVRKFGDNMNVTIGPIRRLQFRVVGDTHGRQAALKYKLLLPK